VANGVVKLGCQESCSRDTAMPQGESPYIAGERMATGQFIGEEVVGAGEETTGI